MKKVLLFCLLFCSFKIVLAQRHELGLFMGGANVIGDVGSGNYINPFPVKQQKNGTYFLNGSLGLLYRFNLNPYMGLRANVSFSRVAAGDHSSDEKYKLDRNKAFGNNILEGSLVYEYNFLDINEEQYFAHSPYIFFGVGLANYSVVKYDANNKVLSSKRENNFVLPFGVGYKVKFNYNWVISAESGFRYTGKDDLDRIVDNLNKDWYVLSGLTLTYTFGRPACYCY